MFILTMFIASCSSAPKPQPNKPLPTWTASDFNCGSEPGPPSQVTTKGANEVYLARLLEWGRVCDTKLRARGADAARYELIVK